MVVVGEGISPIQIQLIHIPPPLLLRAFSRSLLYPCTPPHSTRPQSGLQGSATSSRDSSKVAHFLSLNDTAIRPGHFLGSTPSSLSTGRIGRSPHSLGSPASLRHTPPSSCPLLPPPGPRPNVRPRYTSHRTPCGLIA
jgi:hypothetical protein